MHFSEVLWDCVNNKNIQTLYCQSARQVLGLRWRKSKYEAENLDVKC